MTGGPAATPGERVGCSLCGTTVQAPVPLTWSTSTGTSTSTSTGTGSRGLTHACDLCTRQHLRAMEARLDEEHW